MAIDWTIEAPEIVSEAVKQGVDPFFIAAIRVAENGAPGKEFGVLSVYAPTYRDQLEEACATVRHRLLAFDVDNQSLQAFGPRTMYTPEFVDYFASKWAPPGVANDPTNLNANWVNNAWQAYMRFAQRRAIGG